MEDLDRIRRDINAIDDEILTSLARRREVTERVIRQKAEAGMPLRDPRREEEILDRLIQKGRELGLDSHLVTRIYHEVIDDSVRIQQLFLLSNANRGNEGMIRVAFQGIHGAYSHLAGQKHFAHSIERCVFVGYPSFDEVIEAVEKSTVDFAFLPIENTTAGSINEVFDLLAQTTSLYIIGEEVFRVEHCLLAIEEIPIESVRRVYSHPQALKQCMKFLSTLSNCALDYYTDTAMAARKVREDGDPTQAAIASEAAARQYNLKILRRDCADQKENYTRFLVISREPIKVDSRIPAKTSLVLAVPHEEGSLLKALMVFHGHGINLTKLDGSRPRPGAPFQYIFNVDFEGNLADENVRAALNDLRTATSFLKVLGTYPVENRGKTAPNVQAIAGAKRPGSGPPAAGPDTVAAEAREDSAATSFKLAGRQAKPGGTIVQVRHLRLGGPELVVMAGPSSLRSKEQVLACARHIKECGGKALIGGQFRPGAPGGLNHAWGHEALQLLLEAGRVFDLPVVAEVTHAADVDVLSRQVELLIVGSANMQNTALLTSVGKVNRPVVIERGASSSLEELLTAAELVMTQGNQQVILCERGVRTLETGARGMLDLAAVPQLKRLTHLPIIVNPSHAAGHRDLVAPMALAARAVGPHGLSLEIEAQAEPSSSSPPQALRFAEFAQLMQALYAR